MPVWNPYMPKGSAPLKPATKSTTPVPAGGIPRKVVYMPACVTRMMGPSASDTETDSVHEKLMSLFNKAGYEVSTPHRCTVAQGAVICCQRNRCYYEPGVTNCVGVPPFYTFHFMSMEVAHIISYALCATSLLLMTLCSPPPCYRHRPQVIYPEGLESSCCGMMFNSRGFKDAAATKGAELEAALLKASDNGKIPIVCDTSPCLSQVRRSSRRRLATIIVLNRFCMT